MPDQYLTLEGPSEGYYMDRGSKFLAFAFPAESEVAIAAILDKKRKEHPKARHFCSAFRLNAEASMERSNDDSEPSGSAGKPILGQLIKHNLTNTLIIVVRYFGGTKLGVPGLIEAYKTSAANAIDAGAIVTRHVMARVQVEMEYEAFPSFLNYCKQNAIHVTDETFTDKAAFVLSFSKSVIENELLKTLRHYSRMDFSHLEEYLSHLGMKIEFIQGELIV